MSDEEPVSISVRLGNLDVEVRGEELEDVESTFKDIWERRLSESEEAAEAMRMLSRGYE